MRLHKHYSFFDTLLTTEDDPQTLRKLLCEYVSDKDKEKIINEYNRLTEIHNKQVARLQRSYNDAPSHI